MRKISQVPIRYIVYSHHHDDHISGGSAFGDEAVVVGHANVSGDSGGSIVPVDMTFSDLMSFHLGDLEVQLIYPGPSETDSNIIVLVPERKVAFMVDAVASRRLPWRTFGNANPSEWLAALKELDRLDFEILAPGHGAIGTKANVGEYVQYFTDLIEAVRERVDQGQTLAEIQESLELPAYADWGPIRRAPRAQHRRRLQSPFDRHRVAARPLPIGFNRRSGSVVNMGNGRRKPSLLRP